MLFASCAGFVNGGENPGCGIYRSAGRLGDEGGVVNDERKGLLEQKVSAFPSSQNMPGFR